MKTKRRRKAKRISPWARLQQDLADARASLGNCVAEYMKIGDAFAAELRFVLELGDRPADGKWDHATVARIDAARALAGLPPVQYQPKPPRPDPPPEPAPAAPQIQPPGPPPHLTHVELVTPTA